MVDLHPAWANFVDQYQAARNLKTKAEVIEQALKLLYEKELERSYAVAMREYIDSGDREQFDNVVGDGFK